ncbi:hypothetical protein PZH32_06775 [Adlercreutzia equolifaciens]|uniref:hypothetical protein n=1 Tax=Adlercreutzia equolifaciens TaxID=446660 RepID=UPI0023B11F8F|nr:hypothetical protein [Adlercreutzia equolifaciens]MDE8702665.1 hypothetical protein [Adlercreutzia equolifaciens]
MRAAPDTNAADNPLARAVKRRQNVQAIGTFVGLLLLLGLMNLTPIPRWVCEAFELDPEAPASQLGRAYWDDCFGGPLGSLAAGTLPHPEDLSYAPEADEFLAALEEFAAREEAAQAAEEAEAEGAEETGSPDESSGDGTAA